MDTIKVLRQAFDAASFIVGRKLYYSVRIIYFIAKTILKTVTLAFSFSLRINADSFLFGAVFFILGFYLYGDKFRPGAAAGRNIPAGKR